MDEQLVNQVVAAVMARLSGDAATPASNGTAPVAPTRTVCRLTDSVITGDLLAEHADGVEIVQIAPQAILTPTARDHIRQNGLQITRQSTASANSGGSANSRSAVFRVVATGHWPTVDSLMAKLPQVGGAAWQTAIEADQQKLAGCLAGALSGGEITAAIILSQEAAAVACRLNRNDSVRAAVVGTAGEITALRSELSPNVYCIRPNGRTGIELSGLLRTIASGGVPEASGDM